MSDSDDDLMPDCILKYQNEKSGMHTQRPIVNNTHITSLGIGNHNMSSTFNMQNYERLKNYRGAYDQTSIGYRRDTSPTSVRSFPNSGMQNFNHSYYHRSLSSQRSVFNGRSGSPMSVRSIDSNASVSAADIALAFKNVRFNKYDLRVIKEAYNKFMKNRIRKRVEKRRNLKKFLKSTRRELGDDSGEQGSDSSISDDCRSTRTTIYKENLPISRQIPSRSYMTTIKTTIRESNMYEDCTEYIKQNSLRNMLTIKNTQANVSDAKIINEKPQNGSQFTLKDRFAKRNEFVLPSQRFKKSGWKTNCELLQNGSNAIQNGEIYRKKYSESESENEEIFSEVTVGENMQEPTLLQRKRSLEAEESNKVDTKRKKLSTCPIKNNELLINSTLNNSHDNFAFKKPQRPVRRSAKAKDTIFTDKLISKSAPPLDEFEPDFSLTINKQGRNKKDTNNSTQVILQNNTETEDTNNQTEVSQNTNVSLKPNRRKLFSQKDVLDKINQSMDNVNSPQTKLYAGEKHKVRKLVTSQSCLSRDVLEDDNIIDLIHKIVPSHRLHLTNAINKKDNRKSQDDDKWDVSSVISMCNNDDISETYTDEEIFKVTQNETADKSKNDTKKAPSKKDSEITCDKVTNKKSDELPKKEDKVKLQKDLNSHCKVLVERLPRNCTKLTKIKNNSDHDNTVQNQNKRTVASCVRSFWDTDFESDMEEIEKAHIWSNKLLDDNSHQNNPIVNNTLSLNKTTGKKCDVLTLKSCQNKINNSSLRSEKSKVTQKKNFNNIEETKEPVDTGKSNKNTEANLNNSVIGGKRKRVNCNNTNSLTPAPKDGSKSIETGNKQKKSVKKNGTVNKTRILTPRKVNEKKHQSSLKSNESSFNCSDISSRSLRIRRKPITYKS